MSALLAKPGAKQDSPTSADSDEEALFEVPKVPPGALQTFESCQARLHHALFLKKMQLCASVARGAEAPTTQRERAREIKFRDTKKQTFVELIRFLSNDTAFDKAHKDAIISDPRVLRAAMEAVRANLFQSLPPRVHDRMLDPDEEEEVFYENWPYLQAAYEFLLRFLVTSLWLERKHMLHNYINMRFVSSLLRRFDSEDPRERDYCRMVLIRVYAKLMRLRAPIRRRIATIFHEFTYQTERHNGIPGLLEVLGGIITGFALPVKEEHKKYLRTVLLPMHKVPCLAMIHPQLSYCVTQFVDKDHTLAVPVVRGLLRYWPRQNSGKEVLLLSELEEVLELTRPDEFEQLLLPLCRQLARCIGSMHFQTAQRTLFLWHNEYVASMLANFRAEVFPVLYPALQSSIEHWNQPVADLASNVLNIFVDLEPELVKMCAEGHSVDAKRADERGGQRREKWRALLARDRGMRETGEKGPICDDDKALDLGPAKHDKHN